MPGCRTGQGDGALSLIRALMRAIFKNGKVKQDVMSRRNELKTAKQLSVIINGRQLRMREVKTPQLEPREKPGGEEPHPVIDTSKMCAGQRAARELTEAARESGCGPNRSHRRNSAIGG